MPISPVLDRLTRPAKLSKWMGVPEATDVESSKALLPFRQDAVLREFAQKPIGPWVNWDKTETLLTKDKSGADRVGFAYTANAKLSLGLETAKVNQAILSGKPYSGVGTHFMVAPGIGRKGDYDFTLLGLTTLAYRHWSTGQLYPETKQHLARVLLNQEGAGHLKSKWLMGVIPETENHILMTESARYLKNQLVLKYGRDYSTHRLPATHYDNRLNGFNDWFVNHLSQFLRDDFDEYNSRPYQAYSVRAIQNLYEFADDPRVKTSAQIVLDYLAVRFALQSLDLRRSVPFRRRHNYAGYDNLYAKDSQSSRYAFLSGNYAGLPKEGEVGLSAGHMIDAAIHTYRVPDLVLDLMIDKGHNPTFMVARHANTEIVTAEKQFLISAGGHSHRWSHLPFSKQENGTPMPTVVMLKGSGPLLSEQVRFLGRGDGEVPNNTGVFENLAFGIRPVIPQRLLESARRNGQLIQSGNWTYLAASGAYLAIWTSQSASPKGYAPTVGLVEVVDQSAFLSLGAFRAAVEARNVGHRLQHYGTSVYTTTRGKTVEFVMAAPPNGKKPPAPDAEVWPVTRLWDQGRPVAIERDFSKWPLLSSHTPQGQGFVVKADGTGQVLINNPHRRESLLLSLADPLVPIRIQQSGEAVDHAPTAHRQTWQGGAQRRWQFDWPSGRKISYMSLKWQPHQTPRRVQVWGQFPDGHWQLLEDRQAVFTSRTHPFRTDVDLSHVPVLRAVRVAVDGEQLLEGSVELFGARVA